MLFIIGHNYDHFKVLVYQRDQFTKATMLPTRDYDWDIMIKKHKNTYIPCTPVSSTHINYILYTSGTTGAPKGVVRDTGND